MKYERVFLGILEELFTMELFQLLGMEIKKARGKNK